MKIVKYILFAIAAGQIVCPVQLQAQENSAYQTNQQEQALVLKQDELYGEKVVKVSFNGEHLGSGVLTITDSKGVIVYYAEEFDLVASPNFNAISVSQLSTGQLTFTVTTKVGKYTSTITL